MDFLKQELVRPVVTWLFPGSIVLIPILMAFYPLLPDGFDPESYVGPLTIAFTFGAVGCGLIIDNLGALFETRVVDWHLNKTCTNANHKDDWKAYLVTKENAEELIAHSYYQEILLKLKFELNLPVSLLFFVAFFWIGQGWTWVWNIFPQPWGLAIIFLLAGYLVWEAFQSAKILSELRSQILRPNKQDTWIKYGKPRK